MPTREAGHLAPKASNTGRLNCFAIHGLEPGGKAPSTEEYLTLVHSDDREAVMQEIQKTLELGTGFDFTKRIVRPDGAVRHVRCVGIPAASHDFGPRLVGTGIDVTEYEQLTSALRTREDELRQVLDFTPQLIGVLGPRLEKIFANRMALAYYGLTLDEWRQRSHKTDFHPDDIDRVTILTVG